MNKSTRDIIEREIKKLDTAIDDGESQLAAAEDRVEKIKADLAATRARAVELQRDLDASCTVVNNVTHVHPSPAGWLQGAGPYASESSC